MKSLRPRRRFNAAILCAVRAGHSGIGGANTLIGDWRAAAGQGAGAGQKDGGGIGEPSSCPLYPTLVPPLSHPCPLVLPLSHQTACSSFPDYPQKGGFKSLSLFQTDNSISFRL